MSLKHKTDSRIIAVKLLQAILSYEARGRVGVTKTRAVKRHLKRIREVL